VAGDIQWYTETCAAAAVPALDANVNKAFTTDTPTLLLSGRYDPITPASMGDTVVAGLPNATHVVLPNAAHGAFTDNDCAVQITNQFLTDPRATLDTTCVAAQKVTFATPDTVMETPFTIQLANLHESIYLPLAAMGASLIVMLLAAVLRPLAWLLRVIQQTPQPNSATRTLFGVQWLMIIGTIVWLAYIVYVCVDIINPDGNYGYHTFFGVPTSYQLATTAYAYMATIVLGSVLSVRAIRSQQIARWPVIATGILLLTGVVLVIVTGAIGFIGG
ncbi:MAG: alpha/beta hydrolase, partial [Roseiflexaceae bacterium]